MTQGTLVSVAGPMIRRDYPWLICVSGAISVSGTASFRPLPNIQWECILGHTNSGLSIEDQLVSSSSAIMELRRISGFTWEQLAKLFGVTPRSLHFWASGKLLNAENEEHLQHLLATIKRIDRGNSQENRALLLGASQDGTTLFDLLIDKNYTGVIERVGPKVKGIRPRLTTLSSHSRKSRTPLKPDELVGAMQDSIHVQKGRLISATTIQIKRRK